MDKGELTTTNTQAESARQKFWYNSGRQNRMAILDEKGGDMSGREWMERQLARAARVYGSVGAISVKSGERDGISIVPAQKDDLVNVFVVQGETRFQSSVHRQTATFLGKIETAYNTTVWFTKLALEYLSPLEIPIDRLSELLEVWQAEDAERKFEEVAAPIAPAIIIGAAKGIENLGGMLRDIPDEKLEVVSSSTGFLVRYDGKDVLHRKTPTLKINADGIRAISDVTKQWQVFPVVAGSLAWTILHTVNKYLADPNRAGTE